MVNAEKYVPCFSMKQRCPYYNLVIAEGISKITKSYNFDCMDHLHRSVCLFFPPVTSLDVFSQTVISKGKKK